MNKEILDWCKDISMINGENLFVKKLKLAKLSDKQILSVIDAINTTCCDCYNNDSGTCKCWKDD